MTNTTSLKEYWSKVSKSVDELCVVKISPITGSKFIVYPGEVPWWETEDIRERYLARKRQWKRFKYRANKDFRERQKESNKQWNTDNREHKRELCRVWRDNNQERHTETQLRWAHDNPKQFKRNHDKYYHSPKGKALTAQQHARRRSWTTDPGLYAERVLQLHSQKESCAICSLHYKPSHVIDHIIPLFAYGTDDWDNLQPICIECHYEKTGEDIRKYRNNGHNRTDNATSDFDEMRNRLKEYKQ